MVNGDDARLRRVAVFDAIVNNTDRKAGHLLPLPDGHLHAVDHGVTFSVVPKLRTVLWAWEGEPFDDEELAGLARVAEALGTWRRRVRSRPRCATSSRRPRWTQRERGSRAARGGPLSRPEPRVAGHPLAALLSESLAEHATEAPASALSMPAAECVTVRHKTRWERAVEAPEGRSACLRVCGTTSRRWGTRMGPLGCRIVPGSQRSFRKDPKPLTFGAFRPG